MHTAVYSINSRLSPPHSIGNGLKWYAWNVPLQASLLWASSPSIVKGETWHLCSDDGVKQRAPPRIALAVSKECMLRQMWPLTWLGLLDCTALLPISLSTTSFMPSASTTLEEFKEEEGLSGVPRSSDSFGLDLICSWPLAASTSLFANWARSCLCCTRMTIAITTKLAPTMRNRVPTTKRGRLPLDSPEPTWREVTTTVVGRRLGGGVEVAEGDGVGEGTSKKMELVRVCAVVDVTEGDALGKIQTPLSSCSSANICTNLQDRKSFTHYMQLTMHYVLYITCTSSLTTQLKSSDWRNDPAPEVIAYALTRSFSHAIHWCDHDSLSRIATYIRSVSELVQVTHQLA